MTDMAFQSTAPLPTANGQPGLKTTSTRYLNLFSDRSWLRVSFCCASACALFAFASASNNVLAQNADPFGAAAPATDPFGTAPPAADTAMAAPDPAAVASAPTSDADLSDDPDPVVQFLRSSPPKTPAKYGQALQWLAQLGRWKEIGRHLDRIKKATWTPEQLSELSIAAGAGIWFQIREAGSLLSDEQQAFAKEVAATPSRLARDPQWVDGWINQLASPDYATRQHAQLKLHSSNRVAIERLTNRLVAGDTTVPAVKLIESLMDFSGDGIEALKAASTVADATMRGRILTAIAESSSTSFSAEIGSALTDTELSNATQEALRKAVLAKYATVPQDRAIHDYLVSRFKDQLSDYQYARTHSKSLPATVWRWNPQAKTITAVEATAADRSLELLAHLAAERLLSDVRTLEDEVDSVVVLLQHSYQAQPGIASANPTASLLAPMPASAQSGDFWKLVLDRSHELQMHGASLRAAQVIGRMLDAKQPSSAPFSFVTGCLKDSRPAMRYIATEAIIRSQVKQPYNNSSVVLENLIEMSRLGRGPTVLVVGLASDLRSAAEGQVQSLGGVAIGVNSLQAALQVLDQPYPVELIMVVDRLQRDSLFTLVQRLRNSRRGSALPIAILTEQLRDFELREFNNMTAVEMSVLSHDVEHLPRVIERLESHLDVRPLTGEERLAFADIASATLATIASDRDTYGFYPLARWEKELTTAVSSLPTETWITVLGGLGTTQSQSQLMGIAADMGANQQSRSMAADSFGRSIKQFGLLIDRDETLKAYDLYNTQGPQIL